MPLIIETMPVVSPNFLNYLIFLIRSERNTSERKTNKTIIEQNRVDHQTSQLDRVKRARQANHAKKKSNQLSEKHAQKFAEYYLKLGTGCELVYYAKHKLTNCINGQNTKSKQLI